MGCSLTLKCQLIIRLKSSFKCKDNFSENCIFCSPEFHPRLHLQLLRYHLCIKVDDAAVVGVVNVASSLALLTSRRHRRRWKPSWRSRCRKLDLVPPPLIVVVVVAAAVAVVVAAVEAGVVIVDVVVAAFNCQDKETNEINIFSDNEKFRRTKNFVKKNFFFVSKKTKKMSKICFNNERENVF